MTIIYSVTQCSKHIQSNVKGGLTALLVLSSCSLTQSRWEHVPFWPHNIKADVEHATQAKVGHVITVFSQHKFSMIITCKLRLGNLDYKFKTEKIFF